MSIIAACVVPHPPVIIPAVGKGEEKKISTTVCAYQQVMAWVASLKPDVVIISSPHATMYADYFHISPGAYAEGSLHKFHAPDVSFHADYDTALVQQIEKKAREWRLPAGTLGERDRELDHGTLLPLLFLQQQHFQCPVVRIGLSGLSALQHYRLGQCVAEAVDVLRRRAVWIASGDLSHKLTADGPYGFAQEGPTFDRQVTQALSAGDFKTILSIPETVSNPAAECGLRSFQMMAGALNTKAVTPALLSYEGPFGVGYGVATFLVTGIDPERDFGRKLEHAQKEHHRQIRNLEDVYTSLARHSLEDCIRNGKQPQLPDDLPPELMHIRAAVFVSIKKNGQLRGCIGTIIPTTNCIAKEIQRNAVSAGLHDPRFEPVREEELDELIYSVDVLTNPEPIASDRELDPHNYGVIVENGLRRGLLLPDLEGVDTVEKQISIAREKAGIAKNEPVSLSRFRVVRHH